MKNKGKLALEQDRLWGDHYWLTRQVIIGAVMNDPCLNQYIEYLLENQDDLGNNFAASTGNPEAGSKLAKALRIHINIAIQIVTTAIAGQDITTLYRQWQENASDISKIYSKFNRSIKFKKIFDLMLGHLKTTLDEATAIISKNCEASLDTGEVALTHIRMMSDYLASKINSGSKHKNRSRHKNRSSESSSWSSSRS